MTTTLGYARVSTSHQTLEQEADAPTVTGCERIFTDKMSGTRDDRLVVTQCDDNSCD